MDILQIFKENYISTNEILAAIGEGTIIMTAAGEFIYWNNKARFLLGSDPRNVLPNDWAKEYGLYSPEGDRFLNHEELPLIKAIAGEEFHDYRVLCKNQNFPKGILLSINGKPLRSGNATVAGICTFKDITDQVEENKKIIHEKDFYKDLLDLVPGLIVIKDAKLNIIYANQKFKDLVGESLVTGKTNESFMKPEVVEAVKEKDKEVLMSGNFSSLKEEIIWKNQKRSVLMTTRFPYRDHNRKIIGVCSLAIEVTNAIEPTLNAIRDAGIHTVTLLDQDSENIFIIKEEMIKINQLIEKISGSDRPEAH